MKKLFITLLCFSFLQLSAQSKFSVGIAGSIDRTDVRPNIASAYNKGGLGYSAGIRTRYDFTNWFSIQTGVSFVSTRFIADREGLTYLDEFGAGTTYSHYTDKYKAVTDIHWFQIPVLCSFYFGNQFKVGFSIGSALNYADRVNREITWYLDDSEQQSRSTRKIENENLYGSAIAGVGCEYAIGKFIIRMEPTAQYAFLPGLHYKNDRYSYWSVGLGISSFYRF